MIQYQGGQAYLDVASMQGAILANLQQNGFAFAMGANIGPWVGNSVPFREDRAPDKNAIVDGYLVDQWLGRGWVNVSPGVRDSIVGQMWEIYQNAFEHSQSPVGVYSCGQYYPGLGELKLAVIDLGVGIPSNAKRINVNFSGRESLEWAFHRGTTSDRSSGIGRGLGLDFLKTFVKANGGTLEVFSHDGYARIDENSETYDNCIAYYEGTLVNIGLRCDEQHYYCLSNETPGAADNYF